MRFSRAIVRIPGDAKLERLMRDILDELRAGRIKSSPGVRVRRTGMGTRLDIPKARAADGTQLQTFVVKTEQPDRLICRSWNGTAEGDKDVTVFKPDELVNAAYVVCWFNMWSIRYDPLKLTVDGVLTTSPNKRFSRWENTGNSLLNQAYKEVIWPPYLQQPAPPGQLAPPSNPRISELFIYAAKDDSGRLVDINAGRWRRQWMKEIVVCTKQGNQLALMPSSHVYDVPIDFSMI